MILCLSENCNIETGLNRPHIGLICVSLIAQSVKTLPANAGDLGLSPEWGRSPGEENGNPLQYSCLENPMDGGA